MGYLYPNVVKLLKFFRLFNLLVFSLLISPQTGSYCDDNNNCIEESNIKYHDRYNLPNIYETLTDNYGNKYPALYGTRNMRVVLNGVVYRGGANNVFNKIQKRDNKNPLPDMALQNLHNEGFSTAVYLYKKNFDSSRKIIGPDSNGKTLIYLQNSLSNTEEIYKLLELVYKNLNEPKKGPIYLHCWNGWHQSGYASALILMQFCGYSNDQALRYWEQCASGDLSKYQHIKKAILKFEPFKELIISEETKQSICTCFVK